VPVFHVPLTAARSAASNIAARRASGGSDAAQVHVPEYSAALPKTLALQAPFHSGADLDGADFDGTDLFADHPPLIRTLPVAS
jgi:hypothetical protein